MYLEFSCFEPSQPLRAIRAENETPPLITLHKSHTVNHDFSTAQLIYLVTDHIDQIRDASKKKRKLYWKQYSDYSNRSSDVLCSFVGNIPWSLGEC